MLNDNENLHTESADLTYEALIFQKALRKRWIKSIIRWILTIILYIVFWDKEWVRWSLWIILPLALINLSFMLVTPRLFKGKQNKQNKI